MLIEAICGLGVPRPSRIGRLDIAESDPHWCRTTPCFGCCCIACCGAGFDRLATRAILQVAGRGLVDVMRIGTQIGMRHMQQSLCLAVAGQCDIQCAVVVAYQRNFVAREFRPLTIDEGTAAAVTVPLQEVPAFGVQAA